MVDHEESESDDEYEVKETLVLVDLKGVIDSDFLAQTPFERFKMIGLETNTPILQLNNYHFAGEYDETLGTALFFQEDENEGKDADSVFSNSPTKRVKYVDRTSKLLNMRRVFITERKADEQKDISEIEKVETPLDVSLNAESKSEQPLYDNRV